nr:reverse transcriptase domain-containing protein [Tanacetum cinerariifolium]
DEKEHEEHLRQILKLIKEEELYAEFSKYLEALSVWNQMNMRQCRWLELLSDYDCEVRYHLRKANVVADALSRKEREPPLRVRALENIKKEDVGAMLVENSRDPEKVRKEK